jgi:enoyl-CoA hydratase/carnithine racemase
MSAAVETEPIQYEVDGAVARIWLNRPHKRNSVSQQLLQELDEARIRAENDPDVRVIVIRGREGTFCSGFDLDELQGDFVGNSAAYEIAQRSARICDSIFRSPKPSVSVHEGYTTAGGFEIMINCDFSIAAEDAKIGDFHMRRALFGGAGPIYRLPRILGERRAKELMLTGKLISGRQAYEWGLVNDCAPADELDACVDRFVEHLADKSPFQMGITKMCLNRSLDADTDTLMVMERLAVGVTLNSNDAAEGVAAFLEKRDPVWTGT